MNRRITKILRSVRGKFYRTLPVRGRSFFLKKLSGFERRWELETQGFTKTDLFSFLRKEFGLDRKRGLLVELAAGDGLAGSLGLWLETGTVGWQVAAWEHRERVHRQFRQNRPNTPVLLGRLTNWTKEFPGSSPNAVTTRGAREASGVCRAIREKIIRPEWLGIWNPQRRPVWYRRLRREGYRMELVWQNIEFYRRRSP